MPESLLEQGTKMNTTVICPKCRMERTLALSTYRWLRNRTRLCIPCSSKENLLHVKHPGVYFRKSLEIRFWAKVEKTDTCWIWRGSHNEVTGYGQIQIDKVPHLTHRTAYELTYGPIPDGKFVLHKPPCRNRLCVRPDHLYLGTHQDNMDDMVRSITHCPKGHPYDDENTYHRPDGGRDCKLCTRQRRKIYKARKAVEI